MAISYPFFRALVSGPWVFSIIGCIALAVFGGLMNPEQKWVIFLNTIIPIVAFIFFEYYAVTTYLNLSSIPKTAENLQVGFFWTNQVLAVIFFFATYLSTKTLRGALLADKN